LEAIEVSDWPQPKTDVTISVEVDGITTGSNP